MLITSGGQFSAHHFPSETIPDEILIYLGRVRSFGTPEGTWLIYTHHRTEENRQWYNYNGAVQLADTKSQSRTPQSDGDYVRFYSQK